MIARGRGAYLYDVDGREYLDLISGVGVASLGHANPELARIVAEQATELLHCSNLFFHPYQGALAERLATLSGLPRTFFCNSGTEAVEACLKFARRFWFTGGDQTRKGIVALHGSFHGRTMGSLSVTADPHYRDPFGPLLGPVTFVTPNDDAAIAAAITPETAIVVLEPIQGEGGVRPLTQSFARTVQEACDRTGALLVCDEVQSGLGRTGAAFAFTDLGLRPSLIAIGKALGAGIPVGAALVSEEVASRLSPGDHGSTYGGNLLACRAGLYFVDQLLSGGLLADVTPGRQPSGPRADNARRQARHRPRSARPWIDVGAGPRSACRGSRRRCAGGRPPGQRDGKDGGATVAAAHDHRNRGG